MVVIRQKQQVFPGQRGLAAVALLIAAASGCKSSSWAARPSWLGGSSAASSLGSAPTFNGGVPKPSETAKPYPTTETPEGYVLSDAPRTGGLPAVPAPPTVPSAVTYGTTPPPLERTAAAPGAAPATTTGVATQMGPYAPLNQQPAAFDSPPGPGSGDPAGALTAGLAAAPAFEAAAPPGTQGAVFGPPAGERMADNRAAGWGVPPAAAPAATGFAPNQQTEPADSRYGAASGSRFGGGFQAPPAQPSIEPFATQPPAAVPNPFQQPPANPPPAAVTPDPALPGTLPTPTRRPDPGYRPGGTSSYRPAPQLLEGPEAAAGVQPVGFQTP